MFSQREGFVFLRTCYLIESVAVDEWGADRVGPGGGNGPRDRVGFWSPGCRAVVHVTVGSGQDDSCRGSVEALSRRCRGAVEGLSRGCRGLACLEPVEFLLSS